MAEIARLGANDMVLGITGTNGVTYNLDDMSSKVEGMTFSRTLNISPDADEIAGVQYQSVANALTYIGTQTPVPSDTNRWALWVSGTLSENIDLANMAYIHIVGTGNALLSGAITNSSTSFTGFNQLPGCVVSRTYAISNCTISNLSLSTASFTSFENCKITGASATGSCGLYVNGGMITGGTFNPTYAFITKNLITGGYFGDQNGTAGRMCVTVDSFVSGGGTFYNGAMVMNSNIAPAASSPVLAGGTYYNCFFPGHLTVSFPVNSKYIFFDCNVGFGDFDWIIPDDRNVTLEFYNMLTYGSVQVGSGSTVTASKCLGGPGIILSEGATFDYSDGAMILGASIDDTAIDNSTINDTTIGAATPSTGSFTTLKASTSMVLPEKTPVNAVAATGTITVSDVPYANDTLTVGGQEFTFVGSRSMAGEITISSDHATQAVNIRDAINTDLATVFAAIHGDDDHQVDLTATTKGAAGNQLTLSDSANGITVSGSGYLTGGVDGTVGSAGETCVDASYVYYCIADNTVADTNWRRMALSTSF